MAALVIGPLLASELRALMEGLGAENLATYVHPMASYTRTAMPASVPAVNRDVHMRPFVSGAMSAFFQTTMWPYAATILHSFQIQEK